MQAKKDQSRTLKTLKNRSDFLKIAKEGQRWVSHGLVIQAMPNDLDVIRVGFTVSKKVSKSAVVRNRVKRRLRAVVADTLPLHAKTSCDYVLIGRKETETRSYECLRKDLQWCLRKMGYAREELES